MARVSKNSRDSGDHNFALNMKRIREGRTPKMSQGELAKRMSIRGFDFHQTTISRIESGDRPVSVGEAFALADILKQSPGSMTMPPERTGVVDQLLDATKHLRSSLYSLNRGVEEFAGYRHELIEAMRAVRAEIDPDELPAAAKDELDQLMSRSKVLADLNLETAISAARSGELTKLLYPKAESDEE